MLLGQGSRRTFLKQKIDFLKRIPVARKKEKSCRRKDFYAHADYSFAGGIVAVFTEGISLKGGK